ncbi:MAG: thioredoxin domain-containing protein [Burkholderiales bacterium]|nr:thioredoxin domain-containing protein [Burkholderiales bacterium]
MSKKLFACLFASISINAGALPAKVEIKSIVEFFSFTCSHCANVNYKLNQFVAMHNIKFLDVNIDNSPEALNTTIMYYIAIDAGVGGTFKDAYFKAISTGLPAYSKTTLDYVLTQLNDSKIARLIHSKEEQQKIKLKLKYAQDLINTYNIRATPTFLINQTTVLEGEEVLNSLIGADND